MEDRYPGGVSAETCSLTEEVPLTKNGQWQTTTDAGLTRINLTSTNQPQKKLEEARAYLLATSRKKQNSQSSEFANVACQRI